MLASDNLPLGQLSVVRSNLVEADLGMGEHNVTVEREGFNKQLIVDCLD